MSPGEGGPVGQGLQARSQCFQGRASVRGQGHPAEGQGTTGLGAREGFWANCCKLTCDRGRSLPTGPHCFL